MKSSMMRSRLDTLMIVMGTLVCTLLATALGCESGDGSTGGGGPDEGCGPGQVERVGGGCCNAGELPLDDGRCLSAGMQENGCPAGEVAVDGGPIEGGSCRTAGIPPEMCGEGFEPDGDGGCNAILPAEPCQKGMMAIPGEAECHEVAPCGAGKWGDIPVESNTQFVDGSYGGENGPSDGSEGRPWIAIQDGIDAAGTGALVAVAAGSYVENLEVEGKPVRLWGKCPAEVEVVGDDTALGALFIQAGASWTEVHSIAIRGASMGITQTGAQEVLIDRVWVHDTGDFGMDVENAIGPTDVTLCGSLVERCTTVGVFVSGSVVAVEESVVRGTQESGGVGRGLDVSDDVDGGVRSEVSVRASTIEGNADAEISVFGSDLTLEETVVRGSLGRGLAVQDDIESGERASLILRTSVIDGTQESALVLGGSDATLDRTVVRGSLDNAISIQDDPDSGQRGNATIESCLIDENRNGGVSAFGSDVVVDATIVRRTTKVDPSQIAVGGVFAVASDSAAPSDVKIRSSIVEENESAGVIAKGSALLLEGTIVRDTLSYAPGQLFGRGVAAEPSPVTGAGATVTIRTSVLSGNRESGLSAASSEVTMEATAVTGTLPRPDGKYGRGLDFQHAAKANLRSLVIEVNHDTGLNVDGSVAELSGVLVRGTLPQESGQEGGRGINIQSDVNDSTPANVTVRGCVIDQNCEVGVFVGASVVVVEQTIVSRTTPRASDAGSGRGIAIQASDGGLQRSNVILTNVIVDQNHDEGILVADSDVSIDTCSLTGTLQQVSDGRFGDGIAVFSYYDTAIVSITGTSIRDNARAGLSSFGSSVTLTSSELRCNQVDLDGEYLEEKSYTLTDLGDNLCGCESVEACQVKFMGLDAPTLSAPLTPQTEGDPP